MKRNTFKLGFLLFGLIACASNSAFGQSDKKGERPSIDQLITQMDKDEDGKLSLKEVKGPLKENFSKIDLDEDGFITKEELEKAPKPKRKDRGGQKPRRK